MEAKAINIYQKIAAIQYRMKKLPKKHLNKFQNYRYFTEFDILELLRPLLEEQKLLLLFSDDKEQGFTYEKTEKEYNVRYAKKAEIIDSEQPTSRLTEIF